MPGSRSGVSGSPTNCPTTLELYPVAHSNGSETAPDGLAPSGAHGSKLESLSYHPLLPDNPTGAFKTPTGLPRPVNQVHKLHTLSGAGETRGQSPSFLATRLGLQTGQARLGAVREPDSASYTPWASDGASPSGSPTGL